MWLLFASFGLGASALGVVTQFSPLYLNRVMGRTQQELAWIVWIPFAAYEDSDIFLGLGGGPLPERQSLRRAWPRLFRSAGDSGNAAAAGGDCFRFAALCPGWSLCFPWAMFVAGWISARSPRSARSAWFYPREQTRRWPPESDQGFGPRCWWCCCRSTGAGSISKWYSAIAHVTMSVLPTVGTSVWLWLSRTSRREAALPAVVS